MTQLEVDALKALAGEASVSPDAARLVLDETHASASDCDSEDARLLWGAMEAMVRAGEALDCVALRARLPKHLGTKIVDIVTEPVLGATRVRLGLLRETSLRRQYLEALRRVATLVKDSGRPLADAVAEAGRMLAGWSDETANIRPMCDSLMALVDDMEAIAQGRREVTVRTDIEALDAVVGGLQPTLTVIGALPGVGKSALVAALVRNLAKRGLATGLLSLEDERAWLTRRLLAEAARVPVFVLANKPLRESQQGRVLDAAPGVHALLGHVLCDDRQGLTTAEVVGSARRMVAMGAKAILVDHLGEIRLERSDRHDLDIADALRELRGLAKVYRVPVVVMCHLRRRDGLQPDTEPRLTDFAFSAGVERMARVALGLYRGEGDELRVAVLKQTNGMANVAVALRMDSAAAVVTHSPAPASGLTLYGEEE